MASNDETNETEEQPEKKLKYPKSVFFIIGNEFCERFSYYGLRTILSLYLYQRLRYSENRATTIYHSFTMLAYFSPVFGAILADSYLGKFRTILYVSIVYCFGCVILSIGAYPFGLKSMTIISLIGLVIIALGTGGIKPCVSAFGGDQFKVGQEKELASFFSIFYLTINLGSVLSTILTPILREDVKCFGDKTCYSLAFGVPAMLMIVSLIFFVAGKSLYIIRPPRDNIVAKVVMCIGCAITGKCRTSEKKRSHWLDYAEDKYDKKLIGDIKILLRVLVLYIPLPLFWALFDQMGSRWTLQATKLNGNFNGFHLKPDQMQVVNSLLIVVFIPFFQYVVYPIFNKLHILRKPLQRISAGGILAGVSFLVTGLLEVALEEHYPKLPKEGYSQLTIINNSPCNIKIDGVEMSVIDAFETAVAPEIKLGNNNDWTFNPDNCTANKPTKFSFSSKTSIESMMITLQNNNLTVMKNNDTKEKSEDGEPLMRFFYNIDSPKNTNVSFRLVSEEDKDIFINTATQEESGMTKYASIAPERYRIYLRYNKTNYYDTPVMERDFESGGVYIVYIYEKSGDQNKFSSAYEMVNANKLSILLQIPQYLIMTAGEIMFSITGLEFSYSQSPNSMKSVVQAAWLMTVAFGNIVVMIVAELNLFEKVITVPFIRTFSAFRVTVFDSHEFFLFSGLLFIDMTIFIILAYFYKYVTIENASKEEMEIAAAEERKRIEKRARERTLSEERSRVLYDETKM